ncbi:MAG TPA: hypothetical protein VGK74_05670 [Symbiobacteriaceae bacterium]
MGDAVGEPESQVFVVRCWREADAAGGHWRSQVEHVPSGTRIPLTDLGQLQAILEQYLRGSGAPGGGAEGADP